MSIKTTRRAVLGAGLAAATLPLPAIAQSSVPKPDRIVVNASGGAMANLFRRTYNAEFEKRHGIRVVDTSPVDFGKLRAMVESGNVEWSVTELGGQDFVRAKNMNLLEPLDLSIIDLSKYPAAVRDTHAFPSSVYSTVMAYRTDVFRDGSHPKGWAEFWDVRRFPGPRSLRNHPVDNLEFALLADGVEPDKLYPIDIDRALRKMTELRPHISVWWTTGAQPAQLLVDREVVLASGWNGRFYDIAKRGAPVAVEWQGGSAKQNAFGIPRGAPHLHWANQFLQVMTTPELQAVYATELAYPGLHPDTVNFVAEDIKPHLPTTPANLEKQFWLGVDWWTENGQRAQEAWNRWMLRR
ncbi:ABC transporter substrate-binding protein [Falsiroseomonas sp.]|uniref:ABC transporter substrate-binding protein n=1 Tax=Falsiroseomonas sp. TaxID=2870721 RepID=UPI00271B365A|nr:ABC transporter substrate-binding protein [Falsiroseomonas sp.]MDO9499154.1 ABC transporter substrate-binding protein [Falsiroseomonas sp.]MDP3415072.1 ABC transporter substrate-binding protein [Falsiroseomonas sp.]